MNRHVVTGEGGDTFTERQIAVLDAALDLLVKGGEKAITTGRVAKAANCSKESLYKWFGDRDGLLAAMITRQASKVRGAAERAADGHSGDLTRDDLIAFGDDLLAVLAGPVSLALNRLAIGQGSSQASPLGDLLVARGRRAVRDRARALLIQGRQTRELAFDDLEMATDTLYGLLLVDGHVRLLLGETVPTLSDPDKRRAHVVRAIDQFFTLYGAKKSETPHTSQP